MGIKLFTVRIAGDEGVLELRGWNWSRPSACSDALTLSPMMKLRSLKLLVRRKWDVRSTASSRFTCIKIH